MKNYPQIPPSGIGEAAKNDFSTWFIKLRFQDKSPMDGRWWKEATEPVSSLQTTIGNEYEDKIYENLQDIGVHDHINTWFDWGSDKNTDQFIKIIERADNLDSDDDPIMATQVRLSGHIGVFDISGDADLVLFHSVDDGVQINVFDIKSSWDEKPHQQLQTSAYTLMIEELIEKSSTSVNTTIDGGIIYRETDVGSVLKKEDYPNFERSMREGDLKRVLDSDGPFARAFESTFDELSTSGDMMSPYGEVAAVESIENGGLSSLGLSQSEQKILKEHGISSISELSKLYEKPDSPRPYDYSSLSVNDTYEDTVNSLTESTELSVDLETVVQKAQAMAGEIYQNHQNSHNKPWMPWIKSSGSAKLPEDNPPYETENLPCPRKSLIRVYLNIQYDHVRDTIVGISGRVDCSLNDKEPATFTNIVQTIERDPETWGKYEREILSQSVKDIQKIINEVAPESHENEKYVHFYTYTEREQEVLYEAAREYENDLVGAKKLRALLDMRSGADQLMFSSIEDQVTSKMGIKEFDKSLPSITTRMYCNDESAEFENEDWIVNTSSGDIDLQEAFEYQIFDSRLPVKKKTNSVEVLNKDNKNNDADGFFRAVPRSGSQVPVEYLWSCREIDILDPSWTENDRQTRTINKFRWLDRKQKKTRITKEMYESLCEKFTHALNHIERSLTYRDTDIEKEPVVIEDLVPEEGELRDACRDYLDLESKAQEKEAYEVYRKPLKEKIVDGDSIPIRVDEVVEDKGYMFKAECELIIDDMGFSNSDQIAGSSKIGGSDATSGGDRCVAAPLEKVNGEYQIESSTPEQIAHSTKVSVEEYDPDSGNVIIVGYRSSSNAEYVYTKPRQPWTTTEGSDKPYFGEDEMFVLDPSPDNSIAEKALKCLRNAEQNPVYNDIEMMLEGEDVSLSTKFERDNLKAYNKWSSDALRFQPNEKQEDFIVEDSRYSLLQGPPGTGKTSGSMAHAILARLYDGQEKQKRRSGLVTGLSNKSIDEVMDKVRAHLKKLNAEFDEHPLEQTRLVRLSYGEPDNSSDLVEYLNYNDDEDIQILRNLAMPDENSRQQSLSESNKEAIEHVVFFSTPGRIDGFMKNILPVDICGAEEAYESGYDIFDFLCVDEASMMPIHQLLMTSAFVNDNSQIMLAGDHRQLPPVQQYEWIEEKRKSITHKLPYLSALDMFRYIRGEDVSRVNEEAPDSPCISIPITRLNKTYRCHEDVTKFLKQSIYAHDGIEYSSDEDQTMRGIESTDCKPVEIAMDPDSPITLITHQDRKSKQVNNVEATILSSLTDVIPEYTSAGIVTPHNAQKGKLDVLCEKGETDTVERFQGGEKQVMFLSTTVSDPNQLVDEEDFILSPKRLNVALSRMKRKLVVIVPASVFELVPEELDVYNKSRVWKSLYSQFCSDRDPDWNGQLSELVCDESVPRSNTEISVYNSRNIEDPKG